MKFLSLIMLLGFAPTLFASGSWGGGTPPAKPEYPEDSETHLPCLGTILQFHDDAIPAIPSTAIALEDGYYWILLNDADYTTAQSVVEEKGELSVVSDNGTRLKFRKKMNGILEDTRSQTRIIPVWEYYIGSPVPFLEE